MFYVICRNGVGIIPKAGKSCIAIVGVRRCYSVHFVGGRCVIRIPDCECDIVDIDIVGDVAADVFPAKSWLKVYRTGDVITN